jgi:hypothetical protein
MNDPLTNPKKHIETSTGNVIYSYGSGKIQYQSQIDKNGKIVVLLKPLKKNTTVQFVKVSQAENEDWVLKSIVFVQEDTARCASWTNTQEVNVVIDPIRVDTITLIGKPVFSSESISVLML